MKTGFIYLRVSTPSQQVDEQHSESTNYAERNKIEIIGQYGDYGKRHHAYKRKGFQAMLSDVAIKKPDYILVQRLDRFGTQDQNELGHFLYVLKQQGTRLITTIDGMDRSKTDLTTTILNAIGAGQSKVEQGDKAERVLTGKRGKALCGQYVGSKYYPYGVDLVCIGRDDKEKWRLVEESFDLRIKYVADEAGEYQEAERYGNEIITDPKGIMPEKLIRYRPQKEENEKLFYSPSIRQERVDLVKRIFELFDSGWTSYAISEQLNCEGIRPLFADCWYSALIDSILDNPVYVGKPTFNRTTKNNFRVIRDGRIMEPTEEQQKKTYELQDKENWLQPEKEIFAPMIDVELFDHVQEKLFQRRNSTPKRQPRCDGIWFGGLWVDAETGLKLSGDATQKRLAPKQKEHSHKKLSFAQAESLIGRYLDETGQRLEVVQQATATHRVLDTLKNAEFMAELKIEFISLEIQAYLADKLKEGMNTIDGEKVILDYDDDHNAIITTDADLLKIYSSMMDDDMRRDKNKTHDLIGERDRLIAQWREVSKRSDYLAGILVEEIEKLNSAITTTSRVMNYREWLEQVRSELKTIQDQQEKIRQALKAGEPIAKAKAIRAMIDRIELVWTQQATTDRRCKGGMQTTLTEATFYANGYDCPKVIKIGEKHPETETMTIKTPLA